MTIWRVLLCLMLAFHSAGSAVTQPVQFRVLAFYSANAEPDHVQFAKGAVQFFRERATTERFSFEATTRWDDLTDERLKKYQLIVWLNESPRNPDQRRAFERYMEGGGAWLGFHAAGYNDKETNWPWFVHFLGGGVFDINSWPPLSARVWIDDQDHPVNAGVPAHFTSPANEWYVWKPSPRLNNDVRVLASFEAANYPLGLKDVLTAGDLPVVWTNRKYKMLYMNMGHGDKIFTSAVQNRLIDNAVQWLGTGATQTRTTPGVSGSMPEASGMRVSPRGIALNPRTHRVYVVNTAAGTVSIFNGSGQLTSRMKVGAEPVAIAVDPERNRIYVANSGSASVTVIDGATDQVVATVPVGALPYVVASNSASGKVYVSRTFSDEMTVIDEKTNHATTLKPGVQADAIAVNPVSNKIYLISYESPDVTVIDGSSLQLSKIPAGVHLWAIAADPTANKLYVSNAGNATLTIIDGKSNRTTQVSVGDVPCAIAVDSAMGRIYVANYSSNNVSVMDGATGSVVATVNVGERPEGLAVDSRMHRLYMANTHSGTTSVIDTTNNSVVATLITPDWPHAIAIDGGTHKAFVTSLGGEHVTVIDGKTLTTSSPSNPGH